MSIPMSVDNNSNWRTINIDALDPDSPFNFDVSTLATASPPVSAAEIQAFAAQVKRLVRVGEGEAALRAALQDPPYGADDRGKDVHLSTIMETLQAIRQSEMTPMLERIYQSEGGSDLLDVLMKYLYKGMGQSTSSGSTPKHLTPQATGFSQYHHPRLLGAAEGTGQAMSVLLSWHEKLVEIAGTGTIVRAMADRRTV